MSEATIGAAPAAFGTVGPGSRRPDVRGPPDARARELANPRTREPANPCDTRRVNTRRLGSIGPEVSAIGLGCMGMSGAYGPADEAESVATIRAALDAGIVLLDTGDYYGMGHNELLIREALRGRDRDDVVISVKFGALRAPDNAFIGIDGRAVAVKSSLAYTLRRFDTDHVDVYRLGRVDPLVPIEETVGAIAEMIEAGYVRYVGLSEAGAETVRRAHAVHPVADLQIEYSLLSRGIEREILPTCRELGVGITAYGVLSRGLLGGTVSRDSVGSVGDIRANMPRFRPENLERNLSLVEALRSIAEGKGATVAQVAIAWALSRGEDVVPLIGTTRRERLAEAIAALELELTEDDLAAIARAAPPEAVAGERYDERQMAMLDSERSGGSGA